MDIQPIRTESARRDLGPAAQAPGPERGADAQRRRREGVPHRLTLGCAGRAGFSSRPWGTHVLRTLAVLPTHGGGGGAKVQTANPANPGLHPDGGEAPRSRPPYGNFARKDPFRLGQPMGSRNVRAPSTPQANLHASPGSCIQAGMSRWPCNTRHTSTWSGCST